LVQRFCTKNTASVGLPSVPLGWGGKVLISAFILVLVLMWVLSAGENLASCSFVVIFMQKQFSQLAKPTLSWDSSLEVFLIHGCSPVLTCQYFTAQHNTLSLFSSAARGDFACGCWDFCQSWAPGWYPLEMESGEAFPVRAWLYHNVRSWPLRWTAARRLVPGAEQEVPGCLMLLSQMW